MESYLKIRDKEQTSNEERHDSSSIRGHCFAALLKDYSCDVLTKKKPAKRWRKHILAHVERTNRLQSSIFASRGWATTGRQWYGIPRYIITDNGTPFDNKLMKSMCEKFGFKQHKSSMYNAPANGLAEAFNKTLGNLLKKVVAKNKRDWHERIGEALWAYRTTFRTTTQATPYSLVYGTEAVLPLEQQIPSLRIAIQEGLTSEENAQLRLAELAAMDEKRLEAQQKLECYQARLARAFNKK
ncbi:PREDICTED: uncharacterized protein LOC109221813, partial [Nicotiana attenuata]|uniref:uncharacterized protein LOC109221813 n=1 Tax=Nicotiana attenuata TaxID=49451 RepID=UPI0009051A50